MIFRNNEKFLITTPNSSATEIKWKAIPSDGCIELNKTSGTITGTSGTIELNISFTNDSCIANQSITIQAEDDLGCVQSVEFTFDNPCSDLNLNIYHVSIGGHPLSFEANVTGASSGPIIYTWFYDTTNFDSSSPGAQLILTPKTSSAPTTVEVTCQIYDIQTGCSLSQTLVYGNCTPIAFDVFGNPQCLENPLGALVVNFGQYYKFGLIPLEVSECPGREIINWPSVEITNNPDPDNLWLTYYGDNNLAIYVKDKDTVGTFSFNYRVPDAWGVWSTIGTVTINVAACGSIQPRSPVVPLLTDILTDDEDDPADVLEYDIRDAVFDPLDEVDFGSFDFIQGIGQTRVSATSLTGINGAATYANGKVTYTVSGTTDPIEALQYKMYKKTGELLNTGKIHIDFNKHAITTPDTDAASYPVAEGGRVVIKISDATKTDIKLDTLTIDTEPTKGVVAITDDGFIYTANSGEEGSDSFVYYAYSPDGLQTSTDTVNITIINSGLGLVTYNHCDGATSLDFEDIISGGAGVTSGGSWTADAGNPDTIALGTPTSVSFSGKASGSYTFTHTVTSGSATSVSTLVIRFTLGGFREVTYIGGGLAAGVYGGRYLLENIDVSELTLRVWEDGGVGIPFYTDPAKLFDVVGPDNYTIDEVTGGRRLTFNYTLPSGTNYEVTIQYTDSCGELQTISSGLLIVP